MSELWLALLPFLLADVANPVLFALLVYLSGPPRGVLLSCAALLGHTAAYFASGIVIALAYDQLTAFVANPGPVSYGLGGVLGALLLWVAGLSRAQPGNHEPTEQPPATAGAAFVTGAIINFVGVPFALPYFAAIDQILKTDLSVGGAMMALGGYNLAYAAPFIMVPLLTVVMGERAQTLLKKISEKLDGVAAWLLPLILGAVGLALLTDAVLYFASGNGLF